MIEGGKDVEDGTPAGERVEWEKVESRQGGGFRREHSLLTLLAS